MKLHKDYLAEDVASIEEMSNAQFYGYHVSLTDMSRYQKTLTILLEQFNKLAERKELQPPKAEEE